MRTFLSVIVLLLLPFLSLTSGQNCSIGAACIIDDEWCCGKNAICIGDSIEQSSPCGCKFGYRPVKLSDTNQPWLKPEVDCIKIECQNNAHCLDHFEHSVCSETSTQCACDVGYERDYSKEICRVEEKGQTMAQFFRDLMIGAFLFLMASVMSCMYCCFVCPLPCRACNPNPSRNWISFGVSTGIPKPVSVDRNFVVSEPPPKYTP